MFNLVPWKKHGNENVKVWEDRDSEFHPLAQFRREFDSIWNDFWGNWHRGLGPTDEQLRFGLDEGLEDKDHEYVFHADLPGFEADEIDLKLSGNSLMLQAEHKQESKEQDRSSYRYGSYRRSFQLPTEIEVEQIDAKYHNGVLEIHLPKSESSKAKRIPVSEK